jgi:hypothetical protein
MSRPQKLDSDVIQAWLDANPGWAAGDGDRADQGREPAALISARFRPG